MKQFSDEETTTFHFAKGLVNSPPPAWLAEQLEGPPHLRFFEWDLAVLDEGYENHVRKYGIHNRGKDPLGMIGEGEQDLEGPGELGPLSAEILEPKLWSVGVALEYLHNIMEDEGPFHGVVGVSEGASVAATLLIDDIQQCKDKQLKSHLRCGLFFIGAPAYWAETARPIGKEDGQVIDVPTCHVMGSTDVFRDGGEQLLNSCHADKALVINHSGGHIVPQDLSINKKIADWIKEQERAI